MKAISVKETDADYTVFAQRRTNAEAADTFIKKVYAYKEKRIEIEWNFSMNSGVSQAQATWQ